MRSSDHGKRLNLSPFEPRSFDLCFAVFRNTALIERLLAATR